MISDPISVLTRLMERSVCRRLIPSEWGGVLECEPEVRSVPTRPVIFGCMCLGAAEKLFCAQLGVLSHAKQFSELGELLLQFGGVVVSSPFKIGFEGIVDELRARRRQC